MKNKLETILYVEFLDHSSTSNIWLTDEEFFEECVIEPCKAIGFLEREDSLAYYISSMKSRGEKGSGHTILKSAVSFARKIPQKTFFKSIQHLKDTILVESPLKL